MASPFMGSAVGQLCRFFSVVVVTSRQHEGRRIGRRRSQSNHPSRSATSGEREALTVRGNRQVAHEPIAQNFPTLWHEKDFVGVGIFYFGARRKPANIDVALIRCVRAGHKSRLIRDRNTVREISFGRPRCRRSRGLWRRILFRRLRWSRRLVWIVGLCYRLFWRVWVTRHAMTHRRLIIRA